MISNYNANGYGTASQNKLKQESFNLLQEARRDLIGEIDAIIQYDDHLFSSPNSLSSQTWENIRNEELVHVGELLALLNYLDPSQKELIVEGIKEFNERNP